MAASNKRLDACLYKITWNDLYQKIYCHFTDKNLTLIEFEFLKNVYPDDYLEVSLIRNNKFQDKYASIICRATDDARKRFEESRDYLIKLRRNDYEKYSYDTCPVIVSFQRNWEELVPLLIAEDNDEKQLLVGAIDDLLSDIPTKNDPLNIYERIYSLYEKGHYSQVLAILSVMASTLFHFTVNSKKISDADADLHTLVLPPLCVQEASYHLEEARILLNDANYTLEKFKELLVYSLKNPTERIEAQFLLYMKAFQSGEKRKYKDLLTSSATAGYEPAMIQRNNEKAEEYLKDIIKIYQDPTAIDQVSISGCCKNCENILCLTPTVSAEYRGPASYILYKYSLSGNYTSPSGETAYQFLEISHNCGYAPAVTAWEKHNTFSIIPQYEPNESDTTGICFFNTHNIHAEIFKKTVPTTWNKEEVSDFVLWDESSFINPKLSCRILLIDDDFEKNLSDLLCVLQKIKENTDITGDMNIEIFVRHNSDIARPIIDTAVSHIDNCLIPIYIINDDKSAAQQLLSQHPLFYPVSSIPLSSSKSTSNERPVLHFIVLGTSEVAEWLIREAFWMMGDKNNSFISKITLLDPNAEQFVAQLKTKFPGMIQDSFNIKGIEIPSIVGTPINFDSNQLLDQVSTIIKDIPNCYFAVATPKDETNLSLAMKIREASIRTYIYDSITEQLNKPFPIAFYCKHDYTAWLSRSMVIEKENQGNKWFNTWSLIPFGDISNRYTWNEITGGTFQQLAMCIHYQYSGITPENMQLLNSSTLKPSEMTGVLKKAYDAKKDFFARQYNQDSSYSLALSLPYRIFQFQDTRQNRITPIVWSILDKTVYATAEQLRLLSTRIKNFSMKEDDWVKIAEWEHARWVKWMLSRGWLPATFDEAVFAYNQGNPRQQLFVARLHPCICSYEDLAKLTKILYENCDIEKDFYTADLNNVKATKSILSLEWFKDKIPEQIK